MHKSIKNHLQIVYFDNFLYFFKLTLYFAKEIKYNVFIKSFKILCEVLIMKKMKKILALVLAIVTICTCFAACSAKNTDDADAQSDYDKIVANGKIVVGITDYEPMDFRAGDGSWTGFDAELVEAVAAKMGVEVEFVEINWDNKFTELASGAIDCIWNGMTISDSVTTNCDVSKAYASNSQVVVMKKDVLDKYADTASLNGLSIAVEKGSAGEAEAQKIDGANVLSLTAQADAIKEVKAGTSDACIIDSTMANSMTADGKDFDDLGYTIALTTEEYGVGFRKDTDTAEKIDAILDELKADGTMDSLSEKYGVDVVK